MTNENETPTPPVDRRTASKINPFIDWESHRGTCLRVSTAMTELSDMISMWEHAMDTDLEAYSRALRHQLAVFAAALDFEAAPQDEEPKPQVKEAPVKLVE